MMICLVIIKRTVCFLLLISSGLSSIYFSVLLFRCGLFFQA